jgi:hypothetical protein
MSVSGISSVAFSQFGTPPVPQSKRQEEDNVGRQLEEALQSGNLSQAQQAYNMLAAFGPNQSGPFSQPQMQAEFQTLGADLQSGNLSAAQTDNSTLATNLLTSDVQTARQDRQNGNSQAYQNAMSNLQGDYWAVYGQTPNSSDLQAIENGIGNAPVSVQA